MTFIYLSLVVSARATRGWPLNVWPLLVASRQMKKRTKEQEQVNKWTNGQMDTHVWGQTVHLSVCLFLRKGCTMAWGAKKMSTKKIRHVEELSIKNRQMDKRTNGRCEWGQLSMCPYFFEKSSQITRFTLVMRVQVSSSRISFSHRVKLKQGSKLWQKKLESTFSQRYF